MADFLKRIAVGVDGSPAARETIALAIRLAQAHGSQLFFGHAVSGYETREGQDVLKRAYALASEHGIDAATRILEGRPAHALLHYADDVRADAIVVGTRCKSGVDHFFLGSTAEDVLHIAEVPVFVAHGNSLMTAGTFQRIVVAIDNSDPSDAAIEFATRLAAADGSRLAFCHVIDEDTLYEEAANHSGATFPAIHEWLREANILTATAAQHAQGAGIPSAETAVLTGNPVTEILGFAAAEHADLIVIGAHGERGTGHLPMGSVAYDVARRSGVPVAVVRNTLIPHELHPHVDWHGYVSLREDK